jgi:aryl-alcohol dehydrogenase-like predicted oxidoreductase
MSANPALAGIPLVLGGNVFGWTADRDTSFAVLDAFFAAGGRMIDTADVYSAWVPGHKGGESEAVLGEWLESRGVRAEMRIHTKTGMLGAAELYAPERIAQSLDRSLERLRTDYIDLYYAHRDFAELPIDEIASAFGATVAGGKVRTIGASNFDAARLSAALQAAHTGGFAPFRALQNEYNLVSRGAYPSEVQQLCTSNGVAMLPFYGLASGFLSGKYRSVDDLGQSIRGTRMKDLITSGAPMLSVMDGIAAETGASLPAIALAWLRNQPGIAAPIASATRPEQLAQLLERVALELNADQLTRLTAAHTS